MPTNEAIEAKGGLSGRHISFLRGGGGTHPQQVAGFMAIADMMARDGSYHVHAREATCTF
jgi:hypothetical protein